MGKSVGQLCLYNKKIRKIYLILPWRYFPQFLAFYFSVLILSKFRNRDLETQESKTHHESKIESILIKFCSIKNAADFPRISKINKNETNLEFPYLCAL